MNLFFAVDEQEGDKGEAMGGHDTGHRDIQQAHKNMRLTQGFGSAFFLRIRIRAKIFMRKSILGVSGGKNDFLFFRFFSRFR